MKNKKGFTLVELLAVIVVLAIVMVLATTTVLPYMGKAREEAFRLEATNVVKSAESAVDLYSLGEIKLKNNANSCKNSEKNTICFTVNELIDLALYEGDKDVYSGSVTIDLTDTKIPSYLLYFKKNDEFKIIGGTHKDYNENGVLSNDDWKEDYGKCNCNS